MSCAGIVGIEPLSFFYCIIYTVSDTDILLPFLSFQLSGLIVSLINLPVLDSSFTCVPNESIFCVVLGSHVFQVSNIEPIVTVE